MKRYITLTALLLTLWTTLTAQSLTLVSGRVTDGRTHLPLAHVSVTCDGVGTVTNEQGDFTLKLARPATAIVVSHVGYKSRRLPLADGSHTGLAVVLQPSSVTLDEIIVRSMTAEELVMAAIGKIPYNYSRKPVTYRGFYRELVQKRRQFISISEAVIDMYKSGHTLLSPTYDCVAIARGRRLLSLRPTDTLGVKMMGGPLLPVIADVVKNADLLFDPADRHAYHYEYGTDEKLDDHLQYVVRMTPRQERPYALFSATLYIDHQTLALTRADLQLDMSNRARATQAMLVRKPATLRFRPRELSFSIYYRTGDDGITHLSYIRSTLRFSCDWRRRLFASSFTAVSEFVATEQRQAVRPIRGRDSFSRRDKLYDKVEYFSDPEFWGPDNIIEPTESLDKAVDRLRRRVQATSSSTDET